jgi:ribosome maturation factor RimP
LRRQSDFERFIGHFAEVRLYKSKDGQKVFLGTLAGWQDGDIALDISGNRHVFRKAEVANVRLRIK